MEAHRCTYVCTLNVQHVYIHTYVYMYVRMCKLCTYVIHVHHMNVYMSVFGLNAVTLSMFI